MITNTSKYLHFTLLAIALVSFPLGTPQANDFKESEIVHIEYPDWFKKDPFTDLAETLQTARADGKQGLMVLFTTYGCSYCDLFIRKSLGNSKIASLVQANFSSVGLEIFDDAEMTDPHGKETPIKQFAKREGVEYSPTLLFYGDGGTRVSRAVGYQSPERFVKIIEYVTGNRFQHESLSEYFSRLAGEDKTAPSKVGLKQDPMFSNPPYALERGRFPASQPLLVIFERVGCSECQAFHADVIASKEVRAVLKEFEIVRLDAADEKAPVLSPEGKKVAPAFWFRQHAFTRVPALVFFDERGNEVLKTDALVLHQRMMNSMNFVLERAYKKGWTYQRFARSKAIEKRQKEREPNQASD